jgi:hypothetical protein
MYVRTHDDDGKDGRHLSIFLIVKQLDLDSVAMRAHSRSNPIRPDDCYEVVHEEGDSGVDRPWNVLQYATAPSWFWCTKCGLASSQQTRCLPSIGVGLSGGTSIIHSRS